MISSNSFVETVGTSTIYKLYPVSRSIIVACNMRTVKINPRSLSWELNCQQKCQCNPILHDIGQLSSPVRLRGWPIIPLLLLLEMMMIAASHIGVVIVNTKKRTHFGIEHQSWVDTLVSSWGNAF